MLILSHKGFLHFPSEYPGAPRPLTSLLQSYSNLIAIFRRLFEIVLILGLPLRESSLVLRMMASAMFSFLRLQMFFTWWFSCKGPSNSEQRNIDSSCKADVLLPQSDFLLWCCYYRFNRRKKGFFSNYGSWYLSFAIIFEIILFCRPIVHKLRAFFLGPSRVYVNLVEQPHINLLRQSQAFTV